ncbi:hypothetical protein IEZ26_03825 [Nocardioides cavernae]|uniref:GH16 domain-containing protein n=1 Tax=Nocardioides cavernae TaxID=1921566 RepID=A0ABR8N6G2_9ACTN|nr:hypothetical protein [Nocardioides cavernae]MBD3923738.1 hypothetical protein [Nocardioides cavernae]MBM7511329.1 hypothetical protein [Nocardioides cavernae]
MSQLARALGTVVVAFLLLVVADAPAGFGGGPGVIAALDPTPEPAPAVPEPAPTPAPEPTPVSGWETVFHDGFDGPAGVWPEQWHNMLFANGAAQNGLGQLDVGHLSQVRTNQGWTFPAGTRVRVTASLLVPDTGSNYAALWVQHPNGTDPREIDVIESYGPLKPAGAQFASHICYDDTPETAVNACAATGRAPVTTPVTQLFPAGAEPWSAFWQYSAEFTVGGDTVLFSASDTAGNRPYEIASAPDPRRVPGNAVPIQVRLSNKDVAPEHAVAGGTRQSMLVDWVTVEVDYP